MQSDAFDFIALGIGVAATLRPAASLLFPQRRLPRLCHFYAYFAVVMAAAFWSIMYVGVLEVLKAQPWYTGGTGTDSQVVLLLLCCNAFCYDF